MTVLLLGLAVFLGAHSVRIVAPDWRARQVARLGEGPWKGLYSLVSVAGLALTVWGYGLARGAPLWLWSPPAWAMHLAALATLPAFVLMTAAYLPGSRIKSALGHPMILGVLLWALAHLLANGGAHDLLLFGAFAAWAALDYVSARARDRRAGTRYRPGTGAGDALVVSVGTLAWAAFGFALHGWLIGVRPLGWGL